MRRIASESVRSRCIATLVSIFRSVGLIRHTSTSVRLISPPLTKKPAESTRKQKHPKQTTPSRGVDVRAHQETHQSRNNAGSCLVCSSHYTYPGSIYSIFVGT